MANIASSISPPALGASPTTTRRPLAAAVVAAIGVAFIRPALGEIVTIGRPNDDGASPDADLLALRPRLEAALQGMSEAEMFEPPPGISAVSIAHGERLTEVCEELDAVCWAIVECAPAQTEEGRALKAAVAMHQLRVAYDGSGGAWPGDGEEMAWDVLSEVAGDAYVPIARPAHLPRTEPGRS